MYAYLHPISVVYIYRPSDALGTAAPRCVNGGAQSTSDVG